MKLLYHVALATLLLSSAAAADGENEAKQRIYAHLLIRDSFSALEEAKNALAQFPESKTIQCACIRALCERGEEIEAWEQWTRSALLTEEEKRDRRMLEMLAWGVLNKGESSTQLNIRFNSLIGAAFTHDAKAIPLLIEQLRSSNALLRSIAVRLAAQFGDAPLKDEVARLLREEKVWYVRLEVIQAVGQLRIRELETDLKEIIGNSKTLAEEKAAALSALVNMYDAVDREELRALSHSDRAGLRQLSAEVIAHLDAVSDLDLIVSLLKDSSPDVRISALNALALLRVKEIGGVPIAVLIRDHVLENTPEVAITAAYVLLFHDEKEGSRLLSNWLESNTAEWRRLASAAVSVSGKYGLKLALRQIKESEDPYVRVNLALGLIGQRVQVKASCDTLYHAFFQEKSTLWMWDIHFNPLFRSLAPSSVKHIDQIPHYPIVIDQLVRLDLLSVLSIVRYPKAQEAVKGFLQAQAWGVTGAAAATLVQEGDEESLSAVRALLGDEDEKIRVQAAFILALVGSDPAAIQVLQEVYPQMDREMKVHILEALAHVGDASSIPFLIEILKEPFQVLRVVAASALIQCLYH